MVRRLWLVIFSYIAFMTSSERAVGTGFAEEMQAPNHNVFEMQLEANSALLFGSVESVVAEPASKDQMQLKGFQFYVVTIKVQQVWSKVSIDVSYPKYKIKFGTMIDEKDPQLPVKPNENLVVVLDEYQPNKVHLLKDHLLNIYEHSVDTESNRHQFISKLTKQYDQKVLEFSDLYRMAYFQQMRVYESRNFLANQDTKVTRSVASKHGQVEDMGHAIPYMATSSPEGTKEPGRNPNSYSRSNSTDELSVFSLLLILVFLGAVSHFLIRHYEGEEEI